MSDVSFNQTCIELDDNQLEEAVVCTSFLTCDKLPDVMARLKPEMFKNPDLAFIFTAIVEQYDKGFKPDYITTEATMRRMDNERTTRLGGLAVLRRSLVNIRHSGNLERYAEEIRRRYVLRLLAGALEEAAGKATLLETDPQELIGLTDAALTRIRLMSATGEGCIPAGVVAKEMLETIREKREKGVDSQRIMTGLDEFDNLLEGMHPGELIVAAGRTSEGKTSVTMHMAVSAAEQGKHTLVFNLEMNGYQLLKRMVTRRTGISAKKLRNYLLTEDDMKTIERFTCYACGAGGDVIEFVMKIENCGFKEAVEKLGGQLQAPLSPAAPLNPPKGGKSILPPSA